MFTYKAADGKTTLHGLIQFPSNFDPSKKYPALVSRLRRPGVGEQHRPRDVRRAESRSTEYGFLVLNLDSRSAPGLGKRHARRDLHEARAGRDRRHGRGREGAVERARTSTRRASASTARRTAATPSVMSLLRHPDVFAAASASSPVTAWYHYDRSTPSATCGSRRRTRRATRRAAR